MDRLFLSLRNTCVLFLCWGNVRAIFHILLAFQLIMSQDRTAREKCTAQWQLWTSQQCDGPITLLQIWCHDVRFLVLENKLKGMSTSCEAWVWPEVLPLYSQTRDFWFLIFLFVFYHVNIFACSNVFHAHFLLSISIRKSVNRRM